MENALREIGFGALHIFQPSLILGERKEQRAVERLGIAVFNVMGVAMLGRSESTDQSIQRRSRRL